MTETAQPKWSYHPACLPSDARSSDPGDLEMWPQGEATPPTSSDQHSTILNVESVEGLLARKDNLCPPDDVEMHERSPYKPFVDLIRELAVALRMATVERQRVEEAYNERDEAFRADNAALRSLSVQPEVDMLMEAAQKVVDAVLLAERSSGYVDHPSDLATFALAEWRGISVAADALSALLDAQRTKP